MNTIFVILWMIFFHIVDDYYLHGWLASAKQQSWWEKNAPEKLYKYDYIWALIMHSFSWAFMIMLPIAYVNGFTVDAGFLLLFIANASTHAMVDHLKANVKLSNLWHDQIAVTAVCLL